MMGRFQLFLRGLSTNWTGTFGVVLTTSSFLVFVFMEILRLLGLVTNAYVGLLTYLVLPTLFVIGLVLIPIGWQKYRKATGRKTDELLSERFTAEMIKPKTVLGSRLTGLIVVLTLINLFFLGVGGARMLHFMDEPHFCGTACHKVMHPEWATYQHSAHAHVRCVDCHVGEGADALVSAKLNGLWQMVSATFNLYERPIPTPVKTLRPARETCEKCHWPEKFYGDRIKVFANYGFDESSTPLYSSLALKVGSGQGNQRGTIHWHVDSHNEVRYLSVNDDREEMRWVEVRKPSGEYWRYENQAIESAEVKNEEIQVLDCVDCHNRATHVYEDPEKAVDQRITAGLLDRALPHLKEQALAVLTNHYSSTEDAMAGIRNGIESYYAYRYRRETLGLQDEIEAAVVTLQETYRRNIHPRMNVTWNVYPDHRGHKDGGGCFRCHNRDMVDFDGESIGYDCTLCHSILSYDSKEQFAFLKQAEEGEPDRRMHEYLRREFLSGGEKLSPVQRDPRLNPDYTEAVESESSD